MNSTDGVRAVLFDVDGTLVDSNYLHVDAWQRALADHDVDVPSWRIHRALGQDSNRLLRSLAGERSDEWIDEVTGLHAQFYRELRPRLRPFDGSRDLLRELAGRDVRVVLATSASEDELAALLQALDADDAIHATTSAGDVDQAKPDPALIEIALQRAGALPANAIMIGDAVFDMQASTRVGVRGVAVLSGGIGANELASAGAAVVFDDAGDLLDNLAALPGPLW